MGTLYRRIYEALRNQNGVHLNYYELRRLIADDDAMRTRISVAAADEAGADIADVGDVLGTFELTWNELKEGLSKGCL